MGDTLDQMPSFGDGKGDRFSRTLVLNTLRASGITSMEQVRTMTDEQLLALPPRLPFGLSIGVNCLARLRRALAAHPETRSPGEESGNGK